MTPIQYLFSVYVSALGTILGTPQVEPDPALIAQLEQERPAAVGKNGADALYAIPQAPTGELTLFCNVDQADCLDAARQNLVAYRAAAQQHKKAWQVQEKAIAALRQYDHFRYTTTSKARYRPTTGFSGSASSPLTALPMAKKQLPSKASAPRWQWVCTSSTTTKTACSPA